MTPSYIRFGILFYRRLFNLALPRLLGYLSRACQVLQLGHVPTGPTGGERPTEFVSYGAFHVHQGMSATKKL